MYIKDQSFVFVLNRGRITISMFLVPTIRHTDNCYLLNVNEYIFKEWFIMGCFLLAIIVMIILFMTNNSRSNPMDLTQNGATESSNSNTELTSKLLRQLIHNSNNPRQVLTYNNFPVNHPGHLSLELRMKLVSIMRSSILADQYRYGSSMGTIYIKNTYRHTAVTPEMAGVVMSAELNPTWVYR